MIRVRYPVNNSGKQTLCLSLQSSAKTLFTVTPRGVKAVCLDIGLPAESPSQLNDVPRCIQTPGQLPSSLTSCPYTSLLFFLFFSFIFIYIYLLAMPQNHLKLFCQLRMSHWETGVRFCFFWCPE